MKKTFTIIITLLAVILLTIPTMAATNDTTSNKDHIQALQGNVEQAADKTITFVDTIDGCGWVLDYIDGLQSGDTVVLVFDDKGTEDIEDDEIIEIVLVK